MSETTQPEDELEHSRAPFLEHLEELRWRLWRAILGVIAAAVVCFLFHDEIFVFLTKPLFQVLGDQGLDQQVKFRTIPGAFLFHFKTAILGGIFFGVPIVLYQLWQFVAPGLYKSEQRLALPFVFMSTVCFVGGGAFAYYLVLPQAFDFLIGYTISEGSAQMVPDITIEDYLGFTSKLLLAFGIVFEMPVAVSFFAGIGLITHRTLIRYWRWAVVCAFILGAMLTPPDYITQTMLAIPLMGLYGISIGLAWFITKSRGEPTDGDAEDEDEDDVSVGAGEDAHGAVTDNPQAVDPETIHPAFRDEPPVAALPPASATDDPNEHD